MNEISIKAYAKINLGLDVLRKRADSYHDLRMIMQSIALHDKLRLTKLDSEGIRLSVDSEELRSDEENIAYKAAKLMLDTYSLAGGIHIELSKFIPMQAGMAGGSADAAAVLRGINTLYNLGLDKAVLMELGLKLGADVPYCICGGTMLAEGIGEVLRPIKAIRNCSIVIVKPYVSVTTKEAYQGLRLELMPACEHPDIDKIIESIERDDVYALGRELKNVFEYSIREEYPEIDIIKRNMCTLGACGSLMTGSGSAVYGLFVDEVAARSCYGYFMHGEGKEFAKQVYLSSVQEAWEV